MQLINYKLLALALLGAATIHTRADGLQFKDTYDVSIQDNGDINFENDNTNRQSGLLAPLTTTALANGSGFVQLGNAEFPNRLVLDTAFEAYVSPNYNFTNGGKFSIDFDVWPQANETNGFTGNWAAIVFGATAQNVFVNASDGMGILFRDDGRLVAFDGGTSLGTTSNAIPTRTFAHLRIEVDSAGFGLASPATVKLFVNDVQVKIDPITMEHVKTNGFNANYITFIGQANGQGQVNGRWIHLFDNLEINATNAPPLPLAPLPLVFEDTYNVSIQDNGDINFENDNTNRQSGLLAPLTTTALANGSGFVQLGNAEFPNRLVLDTAYEASVSPDYNFTNGGKFSIDFDVWPEANETSGFSGNWAGIVFGATTKNAYVYGSDGMAIYFQDNGLMNVNDGSTQIWSAPNVIPTRAFAHIHIEVDSVGFGSPATVKLFVNGSQVKIDPATTEHVRTSGFTANYITFVASANGQGGVNGRWINLYDNLTIRANVTSPPPSLTISHRPDGTVRISWPVSATGYTLQESTALPGGWSNSSASVVVDGSENAAVVTPTASAKFFRLIH